MPKVNNSRIFDSVKNDKNSNPDFNYKKKKSDYDKCTPLYCETFTNQFWPCKTQCQNPNRKSSAGIRTTRKKRAAKIKRHAWTAKKKGVG